VHARHGRPGCSDSGSAPFSNLRQDDPLANNRSRAGEQALPIVFDGMRHPLLSKEAGKLVHQQVIDCLAAVIDNCGAACRLEGAGLLQVLTEMRALNLTDEGFCQEVDDTAQRLATCVGVDGLGALYASCAGQKLSELLGWVEVEHLRPCDVPWNKDSPEISQLETILLLSDAPALLSHLPLLLRAVALCSDKDHEAELRLRMVRMLAALVTDKTISTALKPFHNTLVHSIIVPCGKWFSGRMVERLRESAMALLYLVLKHRVGSAAEFAESEEEILATIRANIDDDWVPELRRCSTEALGEYIARRGEAGRFDARSAAEMTGDLLKRLDDQLDLVRMEAQKSLKHWFIHYPEDCEEARAKVVDILMIHLDDPNPEICEGVKEVLMEVAKREPQEVLQKCQAAREVHKNPRYCDALIEHCQRVPR